MVEVLIIDDSPVARRIIGEHLQQIGCKVAGEAENAAAGLKLFRERRPQVVTLDLIMPTVDGIDAVRALRAMRGENPDARVIVVTAVVFEQTRRSMLEEGALAYIIKPFNKASAEEVRTKLLRYFPDLTSRTDDNLEETAQPENRAITETAVSAPSPSTVDGADDKLISESLVRDISQSAAPGRHRPRPEVIEISAESVPTGDATDAPAGESPRIGNSCERKPRPEAQQRLSPATAPPTEDAIINFGLDGLITSWNRGVERMLGYSSAEAIGQSVRLCTPPELADYAELRVKRKLRDAQQYQLSECLQLQVNHKNGARRDAWLLTAGIYDSRGKLTGLSGTIRDLAERQRVERAQAMLAAIVNATDKAIFSFDKQLHLLSWNQAAGQTFGYSASEALGRGLELIVSADQLPTVTDTCRRIAETGAPANFELHHLRNGIPEILPINAFPLRDETGSIFAIAAIGCEITQPRDGSRELMQFCPYPLMVCDVNLLLSEVNHRALELTGYTRAELIGNRLPLLFADPLAAARTLTQALDQGGIHSEFSLFTKNAAEIPVALDASASQRDETGNSRILVMLRDISEDQQIQRTAFLASALEASADAIFSVNLRKSNIASWNPGAAKLFGYSATDAVGRNLNLLVPLERRAEMTQRFQRCHRDRQTEQYETVCLRKGGLPIDVAVTLAPILDDKGAVLAAAVIMQDIREQHRREAELTKARDLAMEAARVNSEFLASITHDIPVSLNSMLGSSGLLLDTPLSAAQRQTVVDLRDRGNALLTLINKILDFSRTSALTHTSTQQAELSSPESAEQPATLEPPGAVQAQSPPLTAPSRSLLPMVLNSEPVATARETLTAAFPANGFSGSAEKKPGGTAPDLDDACDRAVLAELRADGDDLLRELVEIFQSELSKALAELNRGLVARDCPAVARIAHTLAGNAAMFGAKRMQEIAASIEQSARGYWADRAAAVAEEFGSECERVRRYLEGEVQAQTPVTDEVTRPQIRELADGGS